MASNGISSRILTGGNPPAAPVQAVISPHPASSSIRAHGPGCTSAADVRGACPGLAGYQYPCRYLTMAYYSTMDLS